MILKLHQLTIRNFKGLHEFKADFQTGQTTITGKNGTGKTTVADAWYWLLSDSDSLGQTKFNVISLDSDGLPVNHQDAEVEAEIEIDGKRLTISKIYKQKWTKKRGQPLAELTGHTTEYFWNQLPVSKKQYGDQLSAILPVDMIRTLSDPWHFCARLSADARRKILVSLAGDITQADIIASDPQLATLPDILNGRSIEDAKKITTQNRKKANEQLESLPERIDELRRMLPETPTAREVELRAQVAELSEKIKQQNANIAAIRSGNTAVDDLRHQKAVLQTKLHEAERLARHKHNVRLNDMQTALNSLARQISENIAGMDAINKRMAAIGVELNENFDNRAELMAEWKRTQAERLEIKDTCFACGQSLPVEKINDQISQFNQHKAARLKKINASGEQLHALAAQMRDEKDELHKKFMVLSEETEKLRKQTHAQKEQIEIETNSIPLEILKDTTPITAKIAALDDKIKNLMDDIAPAISAENEALSAFEAQKADLEKILLDFTQIEKITRRIAEREADKAAAGDAFMNAERDLFVIELYGRQLGKKIEQSVSEHFEIVKWKLFELQVNGIHREICEATVGGVPYGTDLNTGAKIMAGLDVIKTLSEHHEIYLPIFIDNAEAVTNWRINPSPQQIVKLVAADTDRLEIR